MPITPINSIEEIQPMDIIVTREKNPISWWIRYKSNGDWSHVCLGGPDGTIFTTTVGGYKLVRAENYLNLKKKDFGVYRHTNITQEQIEIGLDKNYRMLEIPYGYGDLFKLVMSSFRGRMVKSVKDNDKTYFCAEAAAETYKDMGLPLLPHLNLDPSAFTPQRCVEDEKVYLIYLNDRDATKEAMKLQKKRDEGKVI